MPECSRRGQPLDNARERAEYDGPGLELERSVDWSGATKRSVDWSGTPEGGWAGTRITRVCVIQLLHVIGWQRNQPEPISDEEQ